MVVNNKLKRGPIAANPEKEIMCLPLKCLSSTISANAIVIVGVK